MGSPDRDIAQAKDFIASPGYSRHRPEATLLYQLVAEHYPRFRDRRAAAGRALPRYVKDEFEVYLKCDLLEHGFLRVKCDACQAEKLVTFSCKRRGLPRWRDGKQETLMFNGYGEEVAHLYQDLDLRRNF